MVQYPKWVMDDTLSESEREVAQVHFLLRLAALHTNREASFEGLAAAIRMSYGGIHSTIRRGSISPGMAAAIEHVVGQDVLPRELLCPKQFA